MRAFGWAVVVGLIGLPGLKPAAVTAADITPEGKKLAEFLDQMGVDKLWLPKQVVKWDTGEKIRDATDGKAHTHCSAFVAAACKRKDVYILRPPDHSATMLANAQSDWLADKGKDQGWKAVDTPAEAQRLANAGHLVVAVFKEKDEAKHGHIALVRPSDKGEKKVKEEGPQIIQAGMDNFTSASLKDGFKHHPGAFKNGLIRYYVHELSWK